MSQASATETEVMNEERTEVFEASHAKQLKEDTSKGLRFKRLWSKAGVNPFNQVEWGARSVAITGDNGTVVFEQENVEVPKSWSQMAITVVAAKYFRGKAGASDRENSVRQLIHRVAHTIADWGRKQDYFASPGDADAFEDELTSLLLHQKMSFNSPVWFNCGIDPKPQCSACFINSVEDTMESILGLAKTEGMLFKYGSGAGSNLSPLRSSAESLVGGGTASGPVSFMKGFDAFAGVIKSGGRTRRAAKMVILNIDHPDVLEFINCKASEEKKAWALIDAGYDGSINGEAYGSVFFQNSNNSVRVTDDFMQAVENDKEWATHAVTTGETATTHRAREMMDAIAEAAHICGDPGMQFDTTINNWHTCKTSGRINASNPCSEYMFLDDTACNLASVNLLSFLSEDGDFDVEGLRHAVDVTITAQEIIVDNASYPTTPIAESSNKYRTLGVGYANLGAVLMSLGLPYDSEEGRDYAAALTAVLTGEAYAQSGRIASRTGPFSEYAINRESMLEVIRMHRSKVQKINSAHVPLGLFKAARETWDQALEMGEEHGFRNAQVSVLAPTGTIAFMMDCDTTGIEPDIALVKYKKLVGGGMLKIVNNTVPRALKRLGYDKKQIREVVEFIDEQDTIEGAPNLKEIHLPVFDCAFKPANGNRSINPMGHLRMMGAVQPFISGAISKTVNMAQEAATEDIRDAYMEAWKMGLKAVAIYRDGSKRTQPLNTDSGVTKAKEEIIETALDSPVEGRPVRRRLPDERRSITHKFDIEGHEGYITVGMYDHGMPGEIFLVMAKEGSIISGLMDCFATAISLSLQYGVPLQVLVKKFSHTRFEPSGFTKNPDIRIAKSVVDYIFRWLASKFLSGEEQQAVGLNGINSNPWNEVQNGHKVAAAPARAVVADPSAEKAEGITFINHEDAPPCSTCGGIMVRNGACYKCLNCGSTSGCS
jgi:ribonucleoside-diphosphate reductase alpha chain